MSLNSLIRNGTQAFAHSIATHRLFFYSFLSTIAVAVAIGNALRNHSNFYSVAIYLSRSSRSLLIFANFGILVALVAGRLVQLIFFGELRATEVERLHDRAWYFVTESLLAFTIFRDDFDVGFVLMFGFLLFIKSFHWLAADRIEWMDQRPYPGPPLNFHIRMITLFLVLWFVDTVMFLVAVDSTMEHGVGGMVLFASEYAILTASIWNTLAKYLLTTYELRRASQRGGETAPPWENKSMWTFYVELVTDFLKLTTYMAFFLVIMMFYGLPINIIRDVFMTARSFYTRLRALRRYQVATRNMDERYPTATEEEMAAMSDHTCIICREEMSLPSPDRPQTDGPNMTPKKLPCGHIFHFYCLKSWLERQQSCPTCRRSVFEDANRQQQQQQQNGQGAPQPQPGPQPPPQQQQQQPRLQQPQQTPRPARPPQAGGIFQAWMPDARPNGGSTAQSTQPVVNGRVPPAPVIIQQPGGGLVVQYHIPPVGQLGAQSPIPPPSTFPGLAEQGLAGPSWNSSPLPTTLPSPARPAPESSTSQASSISSIAEANQERQPNGAVDEEKEKTPTPPNPDATPTPASPSSSITAREAAAKAALRRFGGGEPAPLQTPSSVDQTAPPLASPTTSISTVDTTQSDAAPPTASSTPPGTSLPHYANEVPRLIPLYDWRRVYSAGLPPISHIDALRGLSMHNQLPISPQVTRVPLTQLPPVLTEDQIVQMDRLTREAINERLKVLEGVSDTIDRCIDELMRMRSALPESNDLQPPREWNNPPADATNSHSSSGGQSGTSPPEQVPPNSTPTRTVSA